MKLRLFLMLVLAASVIGAAYTSVGAAADNDEFWKVWRDKKSTPTEKETAVNALLGGVELKDEYLEVLESDVWQYRGTITGRIQQETNKDLLKALGDFLFDEKEVVKKPAAAEHLVWALYNNTNWATEDKWQAAKQLVTMKKMPDKVKARMLRELGVFRGHDGTPPQGDAEAQKLARTNVKTLVELLDAAVKDKKYPRDLKFLIFDALESLSGQDFADDIAKWKFFADNMKETEPLKPRQADNFKDAYANVEVEGHSFASPTPRPVEMEVLVLPNLGNNDRYWYPYIFQINKTFKCTFVKLPDCSKMKDIEWMKNQDGTENRTAYYYPLAQLVETFEERRKASKQAKVGLVAHGVSGWIALEYLRLHPESVAFAVIIGTWSGEHSFLDSLNACGNTGDECYKWMAEGRRYDPTGQSGALARNKDQVFMGNTGEYKRQWGDPKALEPLFYASDAWQVPQQSNARILVPHYEFSDANKGGKKVDVPTLFIHGAKDPMYVAKDANDYKKVLTNMVWSVYEDSAATPWAEEPTHFFTDWDTLLEKNKIIEKLKKEAENGKK